MKPDKFTINVTSPLDSEYIQKLAFNAGYKWEWGKGIFKDTVENTESEFLEFLEFNAEGKTFQSPTHSCISYKFPSQAEEIVKLFEKEKEPELRPGVWARWHNGEIGIIIKRCPKFPDSWDVKGVGSSCCKTYLTAATNEQIEAHLIKEAKEKGFVVGAKVSGRGVVIFSLTGGDYAHFHPTHTDTIKSFKLSDKNELYVQFDGDHTLHFKLSDFDLWSSPPKIEINGYKAEFKDWGLDFNGGCAMIDKQLFIAIANILNLTGRGNKKITSVKIGAGEFTFSQIVEIAEYYNKK